MKDLIDAEISVETVFSIESCQNNGNRFRLADYASMHEFLIDCTGWFEEENPEYVYLEWYGILDWLINRKWLCSNIFEIRNALLMLDRQSIGPFVIWCSNNGHDLTTDDSLLMVTRYQDYVHPVYEPDTESEEPDDNPCVEPVYNLIGRSFVPVEVFDDNYN